jgi:hypothetical protein
MQGNLSRLNVALQDNLAGCRRCNTEKVLTCYTEEHRPPTFHVASCILCVGGLTGIIVYALDKLIARQASLGLLAPSVRSGDFPLL